MSSRELVKIGARYRPRSVEDFTRFLGANSDDKPVVNGKFYRGLLFGIPISLALWGLILWGTWELFFD